MIPSAGHPIIRPVVNHLFEAEDLSRRARRAISNENLPAVGNVIATVLIDKAIAELVAARALLADETPSETSHEEL